MQSRRKIVDLYNKTVTSFVRNSLFYGFSLDKRHSVLDYTKFINGPWPGDPIDGKNILSGILTVLSHKYEVSVLDVVERNVKLPQHVLSYINSFSWIRDVQSIGGVGARRYVRDVVSCFINKYKNTKQFWLGADWDVDVTSERIVNWMMSYSFFAIGSGDDFQKEVLSSITEQYSHILKIYKAEIDPLVQISAMKAMLFFLSSIKSNQKRQIKNILDKISKVVLENVNCDWMYNTRNPNSLFCIFRSLIEVRFIACNAGILLNDEIFKTGLSKMASAIRFFRMGDGTISPHSGNVNSRSLALFRNTQHIIDTALSLVEVNYSPEDNHSSISGYDRISTKKVTLIVNKSVSDSRSHFNHPGEPGINIMDFNASFGTDCLIKRSDIAIMWERRMIKARSGTEPVLAVSKEDQDITYMCELTNFDRVFQFAVRREMSINCNALRLSVSEFSYTSLDADVYLRIVLDKNVQLEQISKKSMLIKYGKHLYVFSFSVAAEIQSKYFVRSENDILYPTLVILLKNLANKENQMTWSIESK